MSLRPPKKLKTFRKPMMVRRAVGDSMLPTIKAGDVMLAIGWFKQLRPYDVVIIRHDGLEKLKRVSKVRGDEVYVLGDNPDSSTDSRQFGWVAISSVQAKVMWSRTRSSNPRRSQSSGH